MKVLRALVFLLPMCALMNTDVVRAATAGGGYNSGVGTEDECEDKVSVKKARDKSVGKISCKGNKGE